MSKVTYNVIYQVCGQVTTDIPDDITTREEAVAYLEKNWKNMPFPKNAEYICDSEVLDTEGEITILLFEYGIQKYQSELKEDGLVFIKGKVRGTGENSSLILQTANALKDVSSTLWIGTDDASLNNLRHTAKNFMKNNPGIGDYLRIASKTSKRQEFLGDIAINDELLQKARIQFGSENIIVRKNKK